MHRNQIYSSEFVKEYDRMAFGGYYDYDSIAKVLAGILKDKREILELGIGTGNVAILLAKCGFSVHGIDYSDEMLEILKNKLKNTGLNMVLQKAGSTNFKFPVKFDGIFSHGGAITYIHNEKGLFLERAFLDKSDHIRTFKNVACHLKNGGLFIVNIQQEHSNENVLHLKNGCMYTTKLIFKNGFAIKTHYILKGKNIIAQQIIKAIRLPYKAVKQELEQIGFTNFKIDESKKLAYCSFNE
jgi:cyclopropane fatty-acyl-phospholipid synthase-like methyltransferase